MVKFEVSLGKIPHSLISVPAYLSWMVMVRKSGESSTSLQEQASIIIRQIIDSFDLGFKKNRIRL